MPHQSLIKKIHYRLPTAGSYKGKTSVERPSTLMTTACIKLHKTSEHRWALWIQTWVLTLVCRALYPPFGRLLKPGPVIFFLNNDCIY